MGKDIEKDRIDSFLLNHREIRFDEVSQILENKEYLNDYEKSTLTLIQEWEGGRTEFPIFTSGSTGDPKEIIITRQQMEASAHQTIERLGLLPGDKALIALNTAYIGGKMMIIRSLILGMHMTIIDPTMDVFESLPEDEWFDFLALVPLQLSAVLKKDDYLERLNNFKAIIVGGAPAGQTLLRRIQVVKCPIFATYGMTETVSHIALKRLNGLQPDPSYKVYPGVKIGIDKNNCLTIQAPQTNNERIFTNDIVHIVSNNEFDWVGRNDNVINSGGIKVQLEIVERMIYDILSDFGLENPFFIGVLDDEELTQKMVLLMEGTAVEDDALKNHLKLVLGKIAPKAITWVPEFEYTPTGKIRRFATLNRYANMVGK